MHKRIFLKSMLAVAFTLAGCFPSDNTKKDGAQTMQNDLVDTLPQTLQEPGQSFTGLVIYGDKGYTGVVGSAAYPSVAVDGRAIGKCQKRKAFMVPLEPGSYTVTAHSENTVVQNVNLTQGQIAYLRCNYLRFGVVLPRAVLDTATATEAFSVVNKQ